MYHTKHDLSYNCTKLDYQAVIETAKTAYYLLLQTMNKELDELRDTKSNTWRTLTAGYLKGHASQMAIIAETLSTLNESLTREELIIVNKPEIGILDSQEGKNERNQMP